MRLARISPSARLPAAYGLLSLAAVLVAAVAAAWTRPDPLQPVAEVELILALAWAAAPALAVAAGGLMLAAVATPALRLRSGDGRTATAGAPLAAYGVVTALAPSPRRWWG